MNLKSRTSNSLYQGLTVIITYMLDSYFLKESKNKNIKIIGYIEFTTFTDKSFD